MYYNPELRAESGRRWVTMLDSHPQYGYFFSSRESMLFLYFQGLTSVTKPQKLGLDLGRTSEARATLPGHSQSNQHLPQISEPPTRRMCGIMVSRRPESIMFVVGFARGLAGCNGTYAPRRALGLGRFPSPGHVFNTPAARRKTWDRHKPRETTAPRNAMVLKAM